MNFWTISTVCEIRRQLRQLLCLVMTGMIPTLPSLLETVVSDVAMTALKAAGVETLTTEDITSAIVLLDIDLDAPLGILPQSSEHSDFLMADLGKAKVCRSVFVIRGFVNCLLGHECL